MMSSPPSLSVLITNIILSSRTGTEIITRNLAIGLLKRGHRPIVYTTSLGPIADELRELSIPVVTDIERIARPVDIVHGHHIPLAAVALARFPRAAGVFVSHSFTAWFDAPPVFPSIRRYMAVDETVADRLVSMHGLAPDKVEILLNAVDMARFQPGSALPERPRRALAFAKNVGHLDAISRACAERNISLDVVGQAVGKISDSPEALLGEYDLVFTSAMSALEAMACGRAVIVCDGRGLAGFVTPATYSAWRPLNFGLRTLLGRPTTAAILAEIDKYDPAAAEAVAARARVEADFEPWLDRLVACYHACVREHRADPPLEDDLSRATAKHLQTWQPRLDGNWPWLRDRQSLIDLAGRRTPEFGEPVFFAASDVPPVDIIVAGGFSLRESWGMWTDGPEAALIVRLPYGTDGDFLARFDVTAYVTGAAPTLEADVMLNGEPVTRWRFDLDSEAKSAPREILIPSALSAGAGTVLFQFRVLDPRSPAQLGVGEDGRMLGLGFTSLTFARPRASDDAETAP